MDSPKSDCAHDCEEHFHVQGKEEEEEQGLVSSPSGAKGGGRDSDRADGLEERGFRRIIRNFTPS